MAIQHYVSLKVAEVAEFFSQVADLQSIRTVATYS
tara:strand:- start:796 stop:900 length:105 start_codon:yes stop_codon:yes gene_type:complete